MSVMAVKFFGRSGSRTVRLATQTFFRMSSTDEPSSSKGPEPCPEPPKPREPCPVKTECSAPPPPPPPSAPIREPPPCPPMPQCPPTMCPPITDPFNPCNYCPPPCVDPDYPDLTKLKKLQCHFQKDDGVPVHLKGGKFDIFLYQLTIVLTVVGCLNGTYRTIEIIMS